MENLIFAGDMNGHHPSREKTPSVMADLFGRMHAPDSELFIIRQLDMRGKKVNSPAPPIRPQIHCFFYLLSGEALINIGEESCFFKADECAVIPAGQLFSVRYFDSCTGYMGGFHNDFLSGGNDGKNLMQSFAFLRRRGAHKVFFDKQHSLHIAHLFDRLYDENGRRKNRNILRSYLATLLTEIGEAAVDSSDNEPAVENQLCNRFIEQVFHYCDHRISIATYADQLHVSKNHLHKIVKRFTGKTPLAWIDEAIILEAKNQLTHSDLNVSEIAGKVGVDDPSYFARFFKKHTGTTPIAYREEVKCPKTG